MLQSLHQLPRNIMNIRDRHNIPEFVLHELCSDRCFNIPKAAYIIDNPDFRCIRGVAGFSADEGFSSDIWQNPHEFSDHMNKAAFNTKVRSLCNKRENASGQELLDDIAKALGIDSYNVCDLVMPHENHGYFMYETEELPDTMDRESLLNGVSILSFCPLY